jgi:CubicO group peptidase (beta-lactamase class C family)
VIIGRRMAAWLRPDGRGETVPPVAFLAGCPASRSAGAARACGRPAGWHRRGAAATMVTIALLVAGLSAGCQGSPATSHPTSSRPVAAPATAVSPATPDSKSLTAAVDMFFERSYAAGKGNVRAVLITVDGRPVVTRYYRDSGPSDTANVYSVTKSVVSTLVGIALSEGRLHGLDQTLSQLLPAFASVMKPDVATITLRQLLTMTAGL